MQTNCGNQTHPIKNCANHKQGCSKVQVFTPVPLPPRGAARPPRGAWCAPSRSPAGCPGSSILIELDGRVTPSPRKLMRDGAAALHDMRTPGFSILLLFDFWWPGTHPPSLQALLAARRPSRAQSGSPASCSQTRHLCSAPASAATALLAGSCRGTQPADSGLGASAATIAAAARPPALMADRWVRLNQQLLGLLQHFRAPCTNAADERALAAQVAAFRAAAGVAKGAPPPPPPISDELFR